MEIDEFNVILLQLKYFETLEEFPPNMQVGKISPGAGRFTPMP